MKLLRPSNAGHEVFDIEIEFALDCTCEETSEHTMDSPDLEMLVDCPHCDKEYKFVYNAEQETMEVYEYYEHPVPLFDN